MLISPRTIRGLFATSEKMYICLLNLFFTFTEKHNAIILNSLETMMAFFSIWLCFSRTSYGYGSRLNRQPYFVT